MTLYKLEGDRMMAKHLQNFIVIPILFLMIFLPDFVARSKNHGNCSPCRMNLYKVLFIS